MKIVAAFHREAGARVNVNMVGGMTWALHDAITGVTDRGMDVHGLREAPHVAVQLRA
jgi:hypothetical protein